ncbi:tRNA synthetase class I [Encephalitozoon hellem ATCC 50504]|uniref:glutamate--tRNA ligase n=1 Tax=Encephalitozoon hellem TaxID=27973 RepID=A0A9Q9C216_ENCHE|nr:tRNA synthetase class I [Encephalitozoon hellem ATCC 50504]AFM97868.1 tRNA synthetase class I [Encephalitozoon hellem ATCC 50504]UTX42646.1 glutamyl tRNA synthetase [Encephalitozoon hellem]WEL38103.1 glutamyl tRNA synthetase [Encephalitozoon hellem]|eukprot:XP_003886849.1 tRNA synthetase class I [Encephalitozoon hellem ATCC 50504]
MDGKPELKEELVNYILMKKYGREPADPPVYYNALEKVPKEAFPPGVAGALESYSIGFGREEGIDFLVSLNSLVDKIDSDELKDIIFGMININQVLTKLMKDKKEMEKFPDVCKMYFEQFKANKCLLKDFNAGRNKEQGNLDIDGPSGDVVTRFPPEPNGRLHIGHARAALLNWYFASKGKGKLLVRFDDTNPEKEEEKFERGILEDLNLLGIREYTLSHTSDYFEKIIDLAFFLIDEGKAYTDNTPQEVMRDERGKGIESKCRSTSAEESRRIFKEMIAGKASGYCLRAKIDMSNCNKAMRDPVIFRMNVSPHHRTGDKYKVYPTYDFACPIVDSLEGVTLSLRTNEYRDRNQQYYWFIDNLHLSNRPKIHDFSRLNFENTVLSKRKLKYYVDNGFVSGWSDPRLATVAGIKRLGMSMEVLREYILMQGVSQKTCTISWDKVWAMNKKKMDPVAPRYFCVQQRDVVEVYIQGVSEYVMEVPKHRKNGNLGVKEVFYSNLILLSQEDGKILEESEEFTLMNWGNAIVKKKTVVNGMVTRMEVVLNPEGDFKQTKNKISWVSKRGSVIVELAEYGNLMNDEDTEDLSMKFNKDSVRREYWYAESAVANIKEGEVIQFERNGFYYCDGFLVFNLLPFTKQKRTSN